MPPSTAFVPRLLVHARALAARSGFTPRAWLRLERALRPEGVIGRVSLRAPTVDLGAGAGALGEAYDQWLAGVALQRKRGGSYFTPRTVAAQVVDGAWGLREGAVRRVLDPSMGGGRFLLEALRHAPWTTLHGLDIDPLAVWVARLSVALTVGPTVDAERLCGQLRHVDALGEALPESDVIVGNPPWLAHAGRQTVALEPRVREDYRTRFEAFSGFPTTHGMFVEAAARALSPGGVLALLLPTQVADLGGYGPMREALTRRARVVEPLDELGFAQFTDVVGPTLVLRAVRSDTSVPSPAPWKLRETGTRRAPAVLHHTGTTLDSLRDLPRFAPETFGELGVQTAGDVAATLLRPWTEGTSRACLPLREGRDVHPFLLDPPRIALDLDDVALRRARVRVRAAADFARATVVIRQTARHPIAAVHDPACAFRNSLLAGFTDRPVLLVALLNSALFRSLHLATQRDGRQVVFPQMKIAHLRSLPAPPPSLDVAALEALAQRAGAAQGARREARSSLAVALGRPVPRNLFVMGPHGAVTVDPGARARLPASAGTALECAYVALAEASTELAAILTEMDRTVERGYGV